MGKYQDVNCPICGKPLENGEIVVICPDCGAPYHKDCVSQKGACIYTELHRLGKSWEMPKKEQKFNGNEPKRCSRCGTINPIDGLFCEVCGNPLNPPKQSDGTAQRPNMGQSVGGGQQAPNMPPNMMAYNPFTTPFGGVNPDESIDDIPVKDWAIYIGQNTQYFIPKFKRMSEQKSKASFNFAALFFQGLYFLYRKMYWWGIILLVFELLLSVPTMLLYVDDLRQMLYGETQLWFTSDSMLMMSNICALLGWGLRIAEGVFANKLYQVHCRDKITKLKKEITDHNTYVQTLTKTGSVSRALILIVVGLYFLSTLLGWMLLLV